MWSCVSRGHCVLTGRTAGCHDFVNAKKTAIALDHEIDGAFWNPDCHVYPPLQCVKNRGYAGDEIATVALRSIATALPTFAQTRLTTAWALGRNGSSAAVLKGASPKYSGALARLFAISVSSD
jgi:hypothetical protein